MLQRTIHGNTATVALCKMVHGVALIFLSLGSLAGCGSDRSFPAAPAEVQQYWQLSLNHHAVTLALTAPANQLQLTAVPLTATGDTLATDAHVHFTSSDSAVQVDSTGMLMAHSPRKNVLVIATLTVGGTQGLTLVDTAKVNVNSVSPVPTFARLEVHTPGDSAQISLQAPGQVAQTVLTTTMYDSEGDSIPQTTFYITVQDTSVAGLESFTSGGRWSGLLGGTDVGQTRVIVEATVYGVSKSDTLTLRVGYPIFQIVTLQQGSDTVQFSPNKFTMSPGGIVVFENKTSGSVDVLFDDSTTVYGATYDQIASASGGSLGYCFFFLTCPVAGSSAGNIYILPPLDARRKHRMGLDFRRFLNPGTYTFHSHPFNAQGVVNVE